MSSVSGASGTTLDRFFSVQCCHRTIKTLGLLGLVTNTGFFLCSVVWSLKLSQEY